MGRAGAFDEGRSLVDPGLNRHPGEGRGPAGKVLITEGGPPLSSSPNWAPAFAGVVPVYGIVSPQTAGN